MSKSKDWLTQNQDNMSEWSDMSIHGMFFQCADTLKIQLCMLVYFKVDTIINSSKCN